MKPRIRYLILAGLIVCLVLISCKTTGNDAAASLVGGTVKVQEDLSAAADEYLLNSLAEAEAKARDARSWAEYINGPIHCPNEWKAAEGRLQTAGSRKGDPKTKGEAYERIAEWNGIKLAYDDIYNSSFDAGIKEQQETLAKARGKAVDAGADKIVPDRLAVADTYRDKSKQVYEKGDIYGSVSAGKDAWDRYRILETLALAHGMQQEADGNDFFSLDPDTYKLAADAGNNSVDLYDGGNLVKSQSEANAAMEGFKQVLKNGWSGTVDKKASLARDQRSAAQEVKADVAVRSDFSAADNVYNQAHVALRAENYAEANKLFDESGRLFGIAHDKALEKRRIAEEALRRSQQKLAESEELAQNAEDIIGGSE